MNWYTVEINGRYDGKPLTIRATVQADSAREAVHRVVAGEFEEVEELSEWVGTSPSGQKVLYFSNWDEDWVYRTDHASIDEMVCETVDAAAVARLNGDPVLPLVFDVDSY